MSNWKQDSLTNHVSLVTKGTTPTSIGKEFLENGINFIKAESITDAGKFISSAFAYIDESTHEILKRSQLQNGDILFSIAGVLGRVAVVNRDILPANTNQAIAIIRLSSNSEIENDFLKHLLNSEFVKEQIRRINVQAAQANFSLADINRLQIQFPKEPNKQSKIAKILSTADAVIEKTQAAIAKYKAIKQGMLQDLFTRGIDPNTNKLRPRYQDAPELYKESKLGMIPREWEVKELQTVGDVLSGATPSTEIKEFWDGEITWITPADLSKQTDLIYFTKSFRTITEEGLQGCSAVLVPENSLVISSRAPIGYLSIVSQPFTTNQGCKSIRFFPNQVPEFYYYNLLCNVERLKGMGAGTTFAEISKSDLDFFEVVFCGEPEQIEIANRLKTVDMAIQTEQSYLQKMQSLKKGLMEDLLSGRKQVNIKEPATV